MKSRFDAASLASFAWSGLSGVIPAALSAAASAAATAGPLSAHDLEAARTGFAGYTGAFRALDFLLSAPMMLLPLGTRISRAALASALVTGICGVLAFEIVLRLVAIVPAAVRRLGVRRDKETISPAFISAVSAVAVLTALLSPAWQAEATAPGGAVIGALLLVFALRLATSDEPATASELPSWGLVAGLAASYEPLVFVAALAVLSPRAVEIARAERPDRSILLRTLISFATGLLPLLIGVVLVRRSSELTVLAPMFTLWPRGGLVSLSTFGTAEIGPVMLVVCIAGAVLSLLVADARRLALPLVLLVATAILAITLHVPAGPNRFSPVVLAGILGAYALGAATLGAVVIAIAGARVPFAEASAALVVVLELVLPVRAFDETSARREARAPHAAGIWNDIAWGGAPPGAVVLVSDRDVMRRIASARAAGQMRGDLLVIPTYDILGLEAQHALVIEPKLAPLYRDIALGTSPEELSLAGLAAQRAVLCSFQSKWDRTLARHFVPHGLLSRFEPEPRSPTERKKALDAFLPAKERLVRTTVTSKDPELAAATASLLRGRAIGMAAMSTNGGERELLSRALEDLRAFAPDDPVGTMLVRRSVTTKGAIDVQDLAP